MTTPERLKRVKERADADAPLRLLRRRVVDLDRFIMESDPDCKSEQKHLEDGSPERAYWHYGYMVALRDVVALLKKLPAKEAR